MLRTIARALGLLSLGMGWLNLTEITHKAQLALFIPKIVAGALPLPTALIGGAAALLGLWRKDRLALLAGGIGGVLAVRHLQRVTADTGAFEAAFGPGWQAHIPPEAQAKMLPHRYTLPFPEPSDVVCLRDQVIDPRPDTGRPLLADLWKPPPWIEPTGMAIIYLHGSGWHYADKDFGTRFTWRYLAAQGHLVLDLAYGLAPETDWRGMVADAHQAIEWLKTHATEHQLNPARIVLMGASAGGHLALLAAYTAPEAASVRAVISYYGAADLEFFYRYSSQGFGESWLDDMGFGQMARTVTTELLRLYERHVDAVGRLRLDEVGVLVPAQMIANCLGGTPDDCPDVYREASPLTHVGPHCPPTLLINGTHDLVMKPAMSRRLQRALQQAGVPAVYVELPDTEHGLDLYAQRIAPAFQAATYDVERFLALML